MNCGLGTTIAQETFIEIGLLKSNMLWHLRKGVLFLLAAVLYVASFYLATFIQSVLVPLDWP